MQRVEREHVWAGYHGIACHQLIAAKVREFKIVRPDSLQRATHVAIRDNPGEFPFPVDHVYGAQTELTDSRDDVHPRRIVCNRWIRFTAVHQVPDTQSESFAELSRRVVRS